PDALIQRFSLDAGTPRPALSLYVKANPATGEIMESETRVEMLQVRENLRLNVLEPLVSEQALDDPQAELPYGHWLRPLWRLAKALSAQRDAVRGKTESNNRVEYAFQLEGASDDPDSLVHIVPRRRNAPLYRLIAEYMILANHPTGGPRAHVYPGPAARGHRRAAVHLVDISPAPLRRPGQPGPDSGRRPTWRLGPSCGPVQTQGGRSVRHHRGFRLAILHLERFP